MPIPLALKASQRARSTCPFTLAMPPGGSEIQNRRMKSSEESPKPVSQQTAAWPHHPRHRRGRLLGDPHHLVRIGIVGDAEVDVDAHEIVGERPVDHLVGDEVLVRDQVFLAVAGDDRDEARAQFPDPAERFAERDRVARFDRPVEQDDDPGDEVRDDLLQAETETDADRAGEHRQRGEVDADRGERDHEGDQDQPDLQHLADQDPQRRGQFLAALDAGVEKLADDRGEPERDREDRDRLDDEERRDAGLADRDRCLVEDARHRVEEVEDRQRGKRRGDELDQPRASRLRTMREATAMTR